MHHSAVGFYASLLLNTNYKKNVVKNVTSLQLPVHQALLSCASHPLNAVQCSVLHKASLVRSQGNVTLSTSSPCAILLENSLLGVHLVGSAVPVSLFYRASLTS